MKSTKTRQELDRLNQEGRNKQTELSRKQSSVRDAKDSLQKLKYEFAEYERLNREVESAQKDNASLTKELDLMESRIFETNPKITQSEDVCILI
jgi:predicted  nucleic acid-binding Zn-ribbon protein